jgi:hypothetical protein
MTMDNRHDSRACPDDDKLRRYALGTLTEQEAETVEAHYFACDRCWHELERIVEVRAAFDGATGARTSGKHRRGLQGLAMAAVLAIAAAGLWLWMPRPGEGEVETLRGADGSLDLSVTSSGERWTAEWPDVPGAASYVLEVMTADGQSLLSIETIEASADVALPSGTGGVTYWKVQALDSMRQTIERSDPIEVRVETVREPG